MRDAFSLIFLAAFSSPALCQSIDSNGARTLQTNLSAYIGSTVFDQGAVRVVPSGNAYRLEADFNGIMGLLPGGASFDPSPLLLDLKPLPDGTWEVANTLRTSGWFDIKEPEAPLSAKWSIANGQAMGTYDPALAAFSSMKMSGGAISLAMQEPAKDTHFTIGKANIEMQAARSAKSGIDVSVTQDLTDFVETITLREEGTEFQAILQAKKVSFQSTASGLQSKPLLDLLAFAVANAEPAKIGMKQVELKTLLLAAFPLWNQMRGDQQWHDMEVLTPIGNFGATKVEVTAALDGISAQSGFSYRSRMTGLEGPTHLLPAWAVPLVPHDFDITFGGKNFDFETPLLTIIAAFDLNRQPAVPDDLGERIQRHFFEKQPKFTIQKSTLGNSDYRIAVEGEISLVGEKPSLHAVVDLSGYDKVVEPIKAGSVTDPTAMRIYTSLLALKGLSKTKPDGLLQWAVETRQDGALLVNGIVLRSPDPKP